MIEIRVPAPERKAAHPFRCSNGNRPQRAQRTRHDREHSSSRGGRIGRPNQPRRDRAHTSRRRTGDARQRLLALAGRRESRLAATLLAPGSSPAVCGPFPVRRVSLGSPGEPASKEGSPVRIYGGARRRVALCEMDLRFEVGYPPGANDTRKGETRHRSGERRVIASSAPSPREVTRAVLDAMDIPTEPRRSGEIDPHRPPPTGGPTHLQSPHECPDNAGATARGWFAGSCPGCPPQQEPST
jgi:hypothetical protein